MTNYITTLIFNPISEMKLSFRYTCTSSQQSRNLPDTTSSPKQPLDHSLSWLYDSVHAYVSILICSIYIISDKSIIHNEVKRHLYILKMSISTAV